MMSSIATSFPANAVIASPADYAECRRIMRNTSRNYSFAGRVFPVVHRHHVEALYALLRIGDDLVDVAHQGFDSPLAAIDDWERNYTRAFQIGDSPHPVMRAYLNTAIERSIPPESMMPYFRAMRADLTVKRYDTFADLIDYMEGSALTVGRAMTYILGVRPPYLPEDAIPYADHLSIAMQLSNFWRDIGEDWRRGRVYIPQEDLERFRVKETDIAAGTVTPHFVDLLEFEIERTEKYYESARQGIGLLASGRWAVSSGARVYRAILDAIRRQKYDVFAQRARASTGQKFWHMARAWWDTAIALPGMG
jgi:phytoene synthase